MLQAANPDLFIPCIIYKAKNSECPKSTISFINKTSKSPFKVKLADFYFLHPRR